MFVDHHGLFRCSQVALSCLIVPGTPARMKSLAELERVGLMCPHTGELLTYADGFWHTPDSARRYPTLNGVPVLRDGPAPEIKPPDHQSNPISPEIWAWMSAMPGPVLFLGAGASEHRAPHIFELEYNLFHNTDIVADAHALPFAPNTFRAAVALNVFEHLAEPDTAAQELWRVLRPGGEVLIHTAFLCPLHEDPHHYYNATEFGVARWFRRFRDVSVEVSPNFNPAFTLSWLVSDLLWFTAATAGPEAAQRLGGMTLDEVATFWRELTETEFSRLMYALPDHVVRRFAAGFQARGRKPHG